MKLMKLQLQTPSLARAPSKALGGGASNVFTWPYVFVKFTNVRYFDRYRLSIKESGN